MIAPSVAVLNRISGKEMRCQRFGERRSRVRATSSSPFIIKEPLPCLYLIFENSKQSASKNSKMRPPHTTKCIWGQRCGISPVYYSQTSLHPRIPYSYSYPVFQRGVNPNRTTFIASTHLYLATRAEVSAKLLEWPPPVAERPIAEPAAVELAIPQALPVWAYASLRH